MKRRRTSENEIDSTISKAERTANIYDTINTLFVSVVDDETNKESYDLFLDSFNSVSCFNVTTLTKPFKYIIDLIQNTRTLFNKFTA